MTFPEALRTCIKEKYATFNGRASRSEFWFFELFIWILTLINGKAFIYSVDNFFMEIISGIISIALLAFFVPIVAVAIRRLHDIGKSGWYLLWDFVPIIGWILLIYWLVQPSEDGENRYGDMPE